MRLGRHSSDPLAVLPLSPTNSETQRLGLTEPWRAMAGLSQAMRCHQDMRDMAVLGRCPSSRRLGAHRLQTLDEVLRKVLRQPFRSLCY